MNRILSNWNIIRGFRFVIGLAALIQGIVQKDLVMGLLGSVLLFTALANVGCCGAASCPVDIKENKNRKINYEELDKN